MSTLLEDVCAAIAAIGATVEGITAAVDPPPPKLDTAQLPALYVLTGPASYEWDGDVGYETRTFRVQVAVAALGQGAPDSLEARCRPILVAVRDAFASHPYLNRTVGVKEAILVGDSGVIVPSEEKGQFAGLEFQLRVRMLVRRTYAEYE